MLIANCVIRRELRGPVHILSERAIGEIRLRLISYGDFRLHSPLAR